MLQLCEIDVANWARAVEVEVRPEQVPFVADVQPVALVILAKCYLRPDGHRWTPYLAVDDGQPVGVVAVVSTPDRAHLRHFAVDHRRQRRGYGRMMLDCVIASIREEQPALRHVQVTTHPENGPALSLYESAGFRRTGAFTGIEPVLVLDLSDGRIPA